MRYYRPDLALVHHLGFGFHAEACAPGILALLDSVRERGGLVLEREDGGRAAESAPRVWAPSPEKVVWNWPVLEDRMVEDYE